MKQKLWLVALVVSVVTLSCKRELSNNEGAIVPDAKSNDRRMDNHLKIAVVSDIHYMHPSLLGPGGAAGAAFQNYINYDPKMVEYSDPIFRTVMNEIKTEAPDILLVPGDITKDGEKIGHQAMAGFFSQLHRCIS